MRTLAIIYKPTVKSYRKITLEDCSVLSKSVVHVKAMSQQMHVESPCMNIEFSVEVLLR